MEVFIAPPCLWALSHRSSQDSPSHGSHSQPPLPSQAQACQRLPTVTRPSPTPDTPSLGLPTSAPTLVKIPGRKACLHHLTGLGRSLGGGHGNPLQDSCLENPMDRGAWQATGSMGLPELDTTEATFRAPRKFKILWTKYYT